MALNWFCFIQVSLSCGTSNLIFSHLKQNRTSGEIYILRKFSPSCPHSYATKLFPKQCLCGKKSPSPSLMLLPTNAQGSGFLLNTQQHCFQEKGEKPVQLRCLEKCSLSIQFLNSFVQDCGLYHRCNLTSVSNVCEAAPISFFCAPSGLN